MDTKEERARGVTKREPTTTTARKLYRHRTASSRTLWSECFHVIVLASRGLTSTSWSWATRGCADDIESLEVSILRPGAEIPTIEELRDFWDFYHKRSKGRIRGSKNPYATMKSLQMSAKRFNGGFSRRTGIQMPAELVSLVNKVKCFSLGY
jgi:hypothetical protein